MPPSARPEPAPLTSRAGAHAAAGSPQHLDRATAATQTGAGELIVTHFGPLPPDRPQLAAAEARSHFSGPVRAADDFMVVEVA